MYSGDKMQIELSWAVALKKILEKESLYLREELVHGLENVLKYRQEDVTLFSMYNVRSSIIKPGEIREKDKKGKLIDAYTEDLINPLFAAVYFANAEYYNTKIDHKNDQVAIYLPIDDKKPATYNSLDDHKHEVIIPTYKFNTWDKLLAAMDAESRHAVHNNILFIS